MQILYVAAFEGASTRIFREEAFKIRNDIARFTDSLTDLENVVFIRCLDGQELWEYYDISSERFLLADRGRIRKTKQK